MNGLQTPPLQDALPDRTSWARLVLAVIMGAAAGVGLPAVRWLVRGNADPFSSGWPLDLQISSLALTLAVGILSRRPFGAAIGLFTGLVLYLFVDGRSEYPMSSVMALAIHALLPALAGALCLVLIQRTAEAKSPGGCS
ncbi:MAG: hypothetical protein ACKV0T_31400 [Planctomycetales bacterium]